jgi:microcystin degradation protein MlrC
MRILICQFGNETNTFAPGLTEISMLSPGGWVKGSEVESRFGNTNSYLGGAFRAIYEEGETPLPMDLLTNNGNFGAGPLMSAACAQEAMDHICRQVEGLKGSFDGVYLPLHGAGCCELDEDLEGYTLRRLRAVLGREIPIFCSLDLHANITPEMVFLADGLFSIKEVPHNDCCEAGYATMKHLIRYIRGQENTKLALRKLPLLICPVKGSTLTGPGKQVKDYFESYRRTHNLLDCAFIHGFSATDRS